MLQQMVSAGRLDRSFYTRLIFDNYATGNAVMVVALVYLALALVPDLIRGTLLPLAVVPVVALLINGVVAWLILSLISWFVGTRYLGGHSRLQTAIRVTGFAHVPLAAAAIPTVLTALAAMAWFVAALMVALEVALSLDRQRALGAAVVGFLGWFLLAGRFLL